MTDQKKPTTIPKRKRYNPENMRPKFKKPPVIHEMAHIPFTKMEYDQSVTGTDVNPINFERELMALMAKYGYSPKSDLGNNPILTKKVRGLSISFPINIRDRLIIEVQRAESENIDSFTLVVQEAQKLTKTKVTYPHEFAIRKDLTAIRRVFAVASVYSSGATIVEPEAYEANELSIVRKNDKPFIEKRFIVDGISQVYDKGYLPEAKYPLLNGIIPTPKPQ